MSWETNYTSSTFNAGEHVTNIQTGRNREKGIFGGTFDSLETTLLEKSPMMGMGQTTSTNWEWDGPLWGHKETVTKGYDIVGIDGNQIGTMRDSITAYVEAVQTYLKNAIEATEAEIASAIRGGEAEKAVKAYLEKVKAYVHNLVSTLLAFNDKLADVGNAWVQAQASFGETVNAATGSFSEGTSYTANNVTYSGPSR